MAQSRSDRTIVVKVGGATLTDRLVPALQDVAALRGEGLWVVVVHGGGPEITRWSERLGLDTRFVDGMRYSDEDTVAVAEMALARVGKSIAAALTASGVDATSLGGRDARVLSARRLRRTDAAGAPLDLGLVGEIAGVRTEVLHGLCEAGLVPVLSSVALGEDEVLYNVNADDAAADVAAAMRADCLCLATDVPGVLVPGEAEPMRRGDPDSIRRLIDAGAITGGMRPKVEACLRAVAAGVRTAWIVDGRRPGRVFAAVRGEAEAGTQIAAAGLPAAGGGLPREDRRPEGGAGQGADASREQILDAYDRFIMQTYSRAPAVLLRGRGTTVWDADGRAYLDFLCGISVTNVGHCHPRVVEAVVRQARLLGHTSNLYYTEPQAEVAAALVGMSFPGRVFFCNSGAEATEGALKLARKAAWRRAQREGGQAAREIISFHHAFHGRTYGALAATPGYQEGFGPMLQGFTQLPWNDLEAAAAGIGPQTAGVIVEPVQGEGGVRAATGAFLRRLRELCDRVGACLIFDEVQCGLGRIGHDFAFQHFGVRPDVVTLGKALGAGLPMGAVLAAEDWCYGLQRSDHATTFGGNPIVAAAAAAGLRLLREQGLSGRSRLMGERLRALLREGLTDHPLVREVRGWGLMTGIELAPGAPAGPAVVQGCLERGLLINCTAQTVLRIMPPLTVSATDIARAADIVCQSLRAATTVPGSVAG